MHSSPARGTVAVVLVALLALVALIPSPADSACCYFAAAGQDVEQPAQKAFLTWDPAEKVESFTVQPKFEGNARDFGMVIPTPARPKLDEMPRDFFKELAVFTMLKQREQSMSSLMRPFGMLGGGGALGGALGAMGGVIGGLGGFPFRPPAVQVLETGAVGSLHYKILTSGRADDLYTWLKENKYRYAGDEATLDFYVKKKWVFTVMKIDAMQMKRNADGTYTGELTPTRFRFASDKLVYPLKITSLSVKDSTDALFYVQAPQKVDLPGDRTYQFEWVALLDNAKKQLHGQKLPGGGDAWLDTVQRENPNLMDRAEKLGFTFTAEQPVPNQDGITPTTLEWAKRLTKQDVGMLTGRVPFSEKVPDVDEAFTPADLKDPQRAKAAELVIAKRLEQCRVEHPNGYLVREAPAKDVKALKILAGHVKEGRFLTKLRKTFTKAEMNDDLEFVPARVGKAEDRSEYDEVLPSLPP